jgi:hypothetical protein
MQACEYCHNNLDLYDARDLLKRAEHNVDMYIKKNPKYSMSPSHKSPIRKSPIRKSSGRSNTSTSKGGSRKRNRKLVHKTRRIRKRLYRSKK